MGRYLRRSPVAVSRLMAIDFLLTVRSIFKVPPELPKKLKRILICNPAHLGDIVISTAIIRLLHEQLPDVQIDFLAGDWATPILANHPGLGKVYTLNHPMLNRSASSMGEKVARYRTMADQVLADVGEAEYDVAFCLYSYEPSFIPFLRQIPNLPVVGFSSAGYAPLLSQVHVQGGSTQHEAQTQASLFRNWIDVPTDNGAFIPWLHYLPSSSRQFPLRVVLHPGCGAPAKEWPISNWCALAEKISIFDIEIFITGHGEREKQFALKIQQSVPKIINMVGQFAFKEFIDLIGSSDLVIGVDSVACHLAAAHHVQSIVIASASADMVRWKPLGDRSIVISPTKSNTSNAVVSVDQVFESIHAFLTHPLSESKTT